MGREKPRELWDEEQRENKDQAWKNSGFRV